MRQLLAHLRNVGTPALFRAHERLFTQGETPHGAMIILDGAVKASLPDASGEEMIINLYGKSAIIPIAWVNDQSPIALFNYEAVNDVRVLRISKRKLRAAIDAHPEHQREYLDFMVKNQAGLLLRITGQCHARTAEKICYALAYLGYRYGIDRGDNVVEIDLRITQGMLAGLIGQTRESTAKNLKTLRQQGVVEYSRATYRINMKALEVYLGSDLLRVQEKPRHTHGDAAFRVIGIRCDSPRLLARRG